MKIIPETRHLHKVPYLRSYLKTGIIVSEWLLFIANSAIFQLYHGENKLIFEWDNDDEVRFVLDQHAWSKPDLK
jgi:hypothetical protein